jgi:hypothetical protein
MFASVKTSIVGSAGSGSTTSGTNGFGSEAGAEPARVCSARKRAVAANVSAAPGSSRSTFRRNSGIPVAPTGAPVANQTDGTRRAYLEIVG